MITNSEKLALAAKYKELVLNLQVFLDAQSETVYDSPECEPLTQAQSEFSTAFEELTGKSIF